MPDSILATRPPPQPVQVIGKWLQKPIAPCTLLPAGFPGVLLINYLPYLALPVGEPPKEGEPVVRGLQRHGPPR